MKTGSSNFFKEHYDWLVALAGFAALAVAIAFLLISFGKSPEGGASEYTAIVGSKRSQGEGIAKNDMSQFDAVVRGVKKPAALQDIDPKKASFLASGRRITCTSANGKACGRPIPPGLAKCPFCGAEQPKEVKVAIDTDKDGIPNDAEVALGLDPNNPADANGDLDGDGFTNLEEFLAKTDPKDRNSHPDYLDSLSVDGKPETTTLHVFFKGLDKLGGGKFRYVFRDPAAKNPYGGRGVDYRVEPGEEICKTGFVPVEYTEKFEKQAIKGGAGMTKTVDVSTVKLVRKSDKKELLISINQRNAPIDMQATLLYRRGTDRKIVVAKGSEFDLNGQKYKVVALTPVGADGVEVTVKPEPLGAERVIK